MYLNFLACTYRCAQSPRASAGVLGHYRARRGLARTWVNVINTIIVVGVVIIITTTIINPWWVSLKKISASLWVSVCYLRRCMCVRVSTNLYVGLLLVFFFLACKTLSQTFSYYFIYFTVQQGKNLTKSGKTCGVTRHCKHIHSPDNDNAPQGRGEEWRYLTKERGGCVKW